MYPIVLTIDIILAVLLCIVVLLQRPDGGALGGLGGGTGSSFMTGRAVGNTLTKVTAWLAFFFFATSLTLGILAKQDNQPESILQNLPQQTEQTQQPQN